MPILQVILVLVAVGVLVGLVNRFGPPYIAAGMIQLINVVAVVACVLWLLSLFGLFNYLGAVRVGK